MIEYVDHLHEHFVEPIRIANGRYVAPVSPGTGAQILDTSLEEWRFPDGIGWLGIGSRAAVSGPVVSPVGADQ